MEGPIRLRRREASQYLRAHHSVSIAPATLAKLACLGGGPRFRKFNRIPLYDAADLDALEHAVRSKTLPPTVGFFFGQTDGSEYEDDLAFIRHRSLGGGRGDRRSHQLGGW